MGLIGIHWVLDNASIAPLVRSVPPGIRIDLTFEGDQASGSAGCNGYGASFQAIGGTISFGPIRQTQKACDRPVMEAEAAYLRSLEGSTAYQASGAGYYVVLHGEDGRDLVFMHLQAGSIPVTKAAPVAAAQLLGRVGTTGTASGPHLHFEIWPDGWWASPASRPIDPLPDLMAWAGTR